MTHINHLLFQWTATDTIHQVVSCHCMHWSLMHSRIDYCNVVFIGLPARDPQRLQSVLNAAVQLVSNSSSRCHVTPLLRDHHGLSVRQRVQYRLCMLVHRCLYREAPSYLTELVVLTAIASNRAELRSAQSLSITVPCTHSTLGDRAFSPCCDLSVEQTPTAHKTYLHHGRFLKELEILSVYMCILTVMFQSVFCRDVTEPAKIRISHIRISYENPSDADLSPDQN